MKADPARETVESLIAEVRSDPGKFADADAVVRRSGYGPTRLSEILREQFHTSPAELLQEARIENAKSRLRGSEGVSVTAVAGEAGFESLSVFHENFRRRTGMTPGAFRRAPKDTSDRRTESPAAADADTFPVPVGSFSVAIDPEGALLAAAFGPQAALCDLLPLLSLRANPTAAASVRSQVSDYFRGRLTKFSLRLRPAGTPFQKRVWAALEEIPCGQTLSYGEMARRLGSSPRAVGRAIATNPLCLFIPCHRVIGADGSLTGYAFGVEIKRRLLAHEAAMVG